MKRFAFFLLWFCFTLTSFAQNRISVDAALAKQYADEGKISESVSLYQSLLKQGFNKQYYEELLQIFYSNERNDDAERLIKQAIKQNKANAVYEVDLGQHYLKTGEPKKAQKIFKKAINGLKANKSDVNALVGAFFRHNNLEYAALTYLKAREIFRDPLLYTYELTLIYAKQGKDDLIAKEYIAIIEKEPSMLNQVKIYLSNLIAQSNNTTLLPLIRNIIIETIQRQPDNMTMHSLLIWLCFQNKDFSVALTYAKSMDKRLESGNDATIFEIAQVSLNNKDYQTSSQAYKYLLDKGKDNVYYEQALVGSLNVAYEEFVAKPLHTEKQKAEIEKQFSATLNQTGQTSSAVPIMLQYASLLAYYLSKPQDAMDMIADVQKINRLSDKIKAEASLMAADILLMNGDVWSAMLEYNKVALDFKNDELGSRAKFAKARLAYFIGDFEQAEMEFDALKASTSKFISNDAMNYSLLIADNMDEDSSYNGLTLYAKADLALYQHNPQLAIKYLDTLDADYLYHPLLDEVLYKRSEIAIEQKEYSKADSLLDELVLKYPYDIMADDALFLSAQINETYLQKPEVAAQKYERIILDYPSSLYVTQSRKRYQAIIGSNAAGI
ncbi:MAG: tetratricopeptide repeat protein [Bacteroidales bacterium]|jgi:tetratricopeptide (TPR) repeat protein|nr:tetratricopeptide repeat protein [Bacteroidales bacterium]